ncbi:hypothetical protein GCM10023185_42530 [Hymenobacter saemangeumensis]|uniref:DUF2281 domain-containing protein n=1 Tax=Hymenobacter saemangeumensis TaxID=1084522 RepID=A0ABP8IRQ2_9BACT
MNPSTVYSKLAMLPENLQQQAADFIEFLLQKAEQEKSVQPQPKPVFGSAKGMFKMRADFDEPLDDFAEYTNP